MLLKSKSRYIQYRIAPPNANGNIILRASPVSFFVFTLAECLCKRTTFFRERTCVMLLIAVFQQSEKPFVISL